MTIAFAHRAHWLWQRALAPARAVLWMLGLAALAITSASASHAQARGQFPALTAERLDQRSVTLPRDFAADRSILLIAFEQRQQADVDSWFPALAAISRARPGVQYYELPTISARYRLARGFIDGGMRSGIPDPAQRARTITLYLDVADFLRQLGLPDRRDQIYAVVIDRSGRVLAAVAGRYSRAKAQQLIASL